MSNDYKCKVKNYTNFYAVLTWNICFQQMHWNRKLESFSEGRKKNTEKFPCALWQLMYSEYAKSKMYCTASYFLAIHP